MIELSTIDYGSEIPALDDQFLSIWSDHYFQISALATRTDAAHESPLTTQTHADHGKTASSHGHFLEIGTGFGVLATGMTRLTGAPCITVEHPSRSYVSSSNYTDFLKQNHITLVGCDLRDGIPFKGETFDTLYICDVIEHLHFHDVRTLLEEAHRLLAPKGQLIISTPNLNRLGNLIRTLVGYSPNPPIYPEVCGETFGHIREFAPKELRALMAGHDFSVTHLRYELNPFFTSDAFGSQQIFSSGQTQWINRVNRWLAPFFPSLGDEIYLRATPTKG